MLTPAPAPGSAERLLKLDEVCGKIGLGRTKLYELIRDEAFPDPVRVAQRQTRWRESEVDQWIDRLPRCDLVAGPVPRPRKRQAARRRSAPFST